MKPLDCQLWARWKLKMEISRLEMVGPIGNRRVFCSPCVPIGYYTEVRSAARIQPISTRFRFANGELYYQLLQRQTERRRWRKTNQNPQHNFARPNRLSVERKNGKTNKTMEKTILYFATFWWPNRAQDTINTKADTRSGKSAHARATTKSHWATELALNRFSFSFCAFPNKVSTSLRNRFSHMFLFQFHNKSNRWTDMGWETWERHPTHEYGTMESRQQY